MDDVKIRVINSDKLIDAIKEGSYDINLSAVMALGLLCQSDSEKQEDCEYCHENSNGCVKPLEKNGHAYIWCDGIDGWHISLKAKGWHGIAPIQFCPKCGRRLQRGRG